jgi:hypothetical protein
MYQKLCRRWGADEGLFRRKAGLDLFYERATVFEHRLSIAFLAHDVIPSGWIGPCSGGQNNSHFLDFPGKSSARNINVTDNGMTQGKLKRDRQRALNGKCYVEAVGSLIGEVRD